MTVIYKDVKTLTEIRSVTGQQTKALVMYDTSSGEASGLDVEVLINMDASIAEKADTTQVEALDAEKVDKTDIEQVRSQDTNKVPSSKLFDDELVQFRSDLNEKANKTDIKYLVLSYTTDIATTRKLVLSTYRCSGLVISYNTGTNWITEQYIGTSFIDADWASDTNWQPFGGGDLKLFSTGVYDNLITEFLITPNKGYTIDISNSKVEHFVASGAYKYLRLYIKFGDGTYFNNRFEFSQDNSGNIYYAVVARKEFSICVGYVANATSVNSEAIFQNGVISSTRNPNGAKMLFDNIEEDYKSKFFLNQTFEFSNPVLNKGVSYITGLLVDRPGASAYEDYIDVFPGLEVLIDTSLSLVFYDIDKKVINSMIPGASGFVNGEICTVPYGVRYMRVSVYTGRVPTFRYNYRTDLADRNNILSKLNNIIFSEDNNELTVYSPNYELTPVVRDGFGYTYPNSIDSIKDRFIYKVVSKDFSTLTDDFKTIIIYVYDNNNALLTSTSITLTGEITTLDEHIYIPAGAKFGVYQKGMGVPGYDLLPWVRYNGSIYETGSEQRYTPAVECFVCVSNSKVNSISLKDSDTVYITGSSLTAGMVSYTPETPIQIFDGLLDINVINGAVGAMTLYNNIQQLFNGLNVGTYIRSSRRSNPLKYIMFCNSANGTRIGINGHKDLALAKKITEKLGAKMLISSEEDYAQTPDSYEDTFSSFAIENNIPYCLITRQQKKCHPFMTVPYKGFWYSKHANHRGKAPYFTLMDLLSKLPVEKSIKMYRPRPVFKNGTFTIDDLMYDDNSQRMKKFTGLLHYQYNNFNSERLENLDNNDNQSYAVPASPFVSNKESEFVRAVFGEQITFNKFALIEIVCDKIHTTSGYLKMNCSVAPTAVYILVVNSITQDAEIITTYRKLTFSYLNGILNILATGNDLQSYDKIRVIVECPSTFTIANPVFYNYNGSEKPKGIINYSPRKLGVELLSSTKAVDWTLGAGAAIDSFPSEIANYTTYNNSTSHIELNENGVISKIVNTSAKKIAFRIVAQSFGKIATIRYNGTGGALDPLVGSKYISNAVEVIPYEYPYGEIEVCVNDNFIKRFTIMQGWHESYFEMDVPSTVLNITITNKSLVDASYRNKPILIHDISIQELSQ
jgi:hypothetical protein